MGPTTAAETPKAQVAATAYSATSGTARMVLGAQDVRFPPRNEPFDFRRNVLEPKYRDQLRRPLQSSFVDDEGTIVWTQEYLRYRVNGCGHVDAVSRVFAQIDGRDIAPVCGVGSDNPTFPPRNEPFDFRQRLEAKYRDELRRQPSLTAVDIEGDIVWTQEYLRYRVTGCAHDEAVSRVVDQIDGRGVQAGCTGPDPPAASPPVAAFAVSPLAGECFVDSGTEGQTRCTFDARFSTGRIVAYEWLMGTVAVTGDVLRDVRLGPAFSMPVTGGRYLRDVRLTVTDDIGRQATTARPIQFYNPGLAPGPPCIYRVVPSALSVPAVSGNVSFSITSVGVPCTWNVTSLASFITVSSSSSGLGTGAVVLSVTSNGSALARTGAVRVSYAAVTEMVTVLQSGALAGPGPDARR